MKMCLSLRKSILLALLICGASLLFTGCAGPLTTIARQSLQSSFIGRTYIANVYLGSRYNVEYTNNSVDGRSPTGTFIDQASPLWYETDASFWDAGSSGDRFTLEELQAIDRDLDDETFAQGIRAGQIVKIADISDKSDQLVFEVETVRKHEIRKMYGVGGNAKPKPRKARIHVVLGKEQMQTFDENAVQPLLDQMLERAFEMTTDAEKTAYIQTHYAEWLVNDLAYLTGLPEKTVREIYYRDLLSRSQLDPDFQEKILPVLVNQPAILSRETGLHLQQVQVIDHQGTPALEITCEFQEISNAVAYYSTELRAGFLFFKKALRLAKPFGTALSQHLAAYPDAAPPDLIFTCSYLYIDRQGQQFPESVTFTLKADDLRQYAENALTDQELADRSDLLIQDMPVSVSLSALEAVEHVASKESKIWKKVKVEFVDWEHEEDEANKVLHIEGEVRNTGNWLAKDVEVMAVGYDKYDFDIRKETTTVSGYLKPGQTESFKISMSTENLKRFKLFLHWENVE